LEIWGQWLFGNQVSEKFTLTYAGKPSLFEGGTTVPSGFDEVKLRIVAADLAGNFGQHTIVFPTAP